MSNRILLLALAVSVFSQCGKAEERITLRIKGVDFSVEVARTEEEKARGLMNRRSLGARQGMLFIFEKDDHLSFWMKNTSIPLSIGFLSPDGRILEIVDMVPFSLKTIRSRNSCRYALELPRGAFDEVGAAEGDGVELPAGFK
jgi:uncharacterized membrane protein (UPF0127 family)